MTATITRTASDRAVRLPPPSWHTEAGLLDYDAAIATMRARATAIRDGTRGELVWLVEHPPCFTAGTSARDVDLFNPFGFPTYAAGRGGQWTYHGPGQRVAYAMLDLAQAHGSVPARDVRAYVDGLERWLIAALARFGVEGLIRPGRVGVWVIDPATGAEAKIGAIGVRVSRWVAWHGVSLNVAPDLSHFDGIVPCGLPGFGVTSLAGLGIAADMGTVDDALRDSWAPIFGETG